MSIAITSTQNTMGVRRLSGYAIRPVWRGPAEPGPRAANHAVTMRGLGAQAASQAAAYPSQPGNELRHAMFPWDTPQPAPSTSSQPSQNPTGSVVSSYTELSSAIAPSVAQTVAPAVNPTSAATVAPASTPG